MEELGGRQASKGPVGAAEIGQDLGEVGGGEGLDGEEIEEGGNEKKAGLKQAGPAGTRGEPKGKFNGKGDERLMGLEGEAEGGQEGKRDALWQGTWFAGQVRGRGKEVGQHKEHEDVVALAEVARGQDSGDEQEERGGARATGRAERQRARGGLDSKTRGP